MPPADAPAAPQAEPRVRFIEHQGKRILFHDLSNIRNPDDALPLCAQSRAIVAQQPPNSLLTLVYVAGSRFNRSIINALRDLARHTKPYVRASALVGVAGLMRVVYTTLMQLTGRKMPMFGTLGEAKNWLVAQ